MIVDAGGLPVVSGGHVREGRLYRVSGGLVTEQDLPRLERLGVRALVDLRGGSEARSVLEDWAAASGVRYVWLPIDVAGGGDLMRAAGAAADASEAAAQLLMLYRWIIDRHGAELTRTIEAIAEGTPVAFGCAAGKDRTGLVTALLHTLLGVDEDDVVRSYAASPPTPDRLRGVLRDQFGDDHELLTMPSLDVLLGAEEETMRALLEYVRTSYGDVDSYLARHGLSDDAIARLREDLIAD
jgi:protein-tyrosine phosphatase